MWRVRDTVQVSNFSKFLRVATSWATTLSLIIFVSLSGESAFAQAARQENAGPKPSGSPQPSKATSSPAPARQGATGGGATQNKAAAAANSGGARSSADRPGDRSAANGAESARRPAKQSRRGKAKKPRAFEESPAPGRSGPTALASAAAAPSAAPRPSVGETIGLKRTRDPLALHSSVALVVDAQSGEVLVGKNTGAVLPIASITKVITAMVVLDAGLPLGERLQISRDDIDQLRHTGSRLHPGARLTRGEMLQLALMASENRAANALGRHYPGGMPAFVAAMNSKARSLGMHDSRFVEPTGLSSANVASGRDLARLVRAASAYPLIRQYSTARSLTVQPAKEPLGFYNTNRLVSTAGWSIGLQKTGFISEAGNCMVMLAQVEGRQTIFVLLDAAGKLARFGDAQRLRAWLEKSGETGASGRVQQTVSTPSAVSPLRVSLEAH
jgi:D-alanyl-D-alanine endopeptidase (penicillin-binding protein 7)